MMMIKICCTALLLAVGAGAASARTIELEVNGLVCAFCAQGIEKTFRALPQTEDVLVSLEHRLVAIDLKDGQDIADPALREAVTAAGYALVAIQRTDTPLDQLKSSLAHTHAEAADDE